MTEANPYQSPQVDVPPPGPALTTSARGEDARFFAMVLSAILLLAGQFIPFQRGAHTAYFLLATLLGGAGLLNPRWSQRLLAIGLLLFAAYSFLACEVLLFYQKKQKAYEQQRRLDVAPPSHDSGVRASRRRLNQVRRQRDDQHPGAAGQGRKEVTSQRTSHGSMSHGADGVGDRACDDVRGSHRQLGGAAHWLDDFAAGELAATEERKASARTG